MIDLTSFSQPKLKAEDESDDESRRYIRDAAIAIDEYRPFRKNERLKRTANPAMP